MPIIQLEFSAQDELHLLAYQGQLAELKEKLKISKFQIDGLDSKYKITLLAAACAAGHGDVVAFLLEQGASVTAGGLRMRRSILSYANNNEAITQLILPRLQVAMLSYKDANTDVDKAKMALLAYDLAYFGRYRPDVNLKGYQKIADELRQKLTANTAIRAPLTWCLAKHQLANNNNAANENFSIALQLYTKLSDNFFAVECAFDTLELIFAKGEAFSDSGLEKSLASCLNIQSDANQKLARLLTIIEQNISSAADLPLELIRELTNDSLMKQVESQKDLVFKLLEFMIIIANKSKFRGNLTANIFELAIDIFKRAYLATISSNDTETKGKFLEKTREITKLYNSYKEFLALFEKLKKFDAFKDKTTIPPAEFFPLFFAFSVDFKNITICIENNLSDAANIAIALLETYLNSQDKLLATKTKNNNIEATTQNITTLLNLIIFSIKKDPKYFDRSLHGMLVLQLTNMITQCEAQHVIYGSRLLAALTDYILNFIDMGYKPDNNTLLAIIISFVSLMEINDEADKNSTKIAEYIFPKFFEAINLVQQKSLNDKLLMTLHEGMVFACKVLAKSKLAFSQENNYKNIYLDYLKKIGLYITNVKNKNSAVAIEFFTRVTRYLFEYFEYVESLSESQKNPLVLTENLGDLLYDTSTLELFNMALVVFNLYKDREHSLLYENIELFVLSLWQAAKTSSDKKLHSQSIGYYLYWLKLQPYYENRKKNKNLSTDTKTIKNEVLNEFQKLLHTKIKSEKLKSIVDRCVTTFTVLDDKDFILRLFGIAQQFSDKLDAEKRYVVNIAILRFFASKPDKKTSSIEFTAALQMVGHFESNNIPAEDTELLMSALKIVKHNALTISDNITLLSIFKAYRKLGDLAAKEGKLADAVYFYFKIADDKAFGKIDKSVLSETMPYLVTVIIAQAKAQLSEKKYNAIINLCDRLLEHPLYENKLHDLATLDILQQKYEAIYQLTIQKLQQKKYQKATNNAVDCIQELENISKKYSMNVTVENLQFLIGRFKEILATCNAKLDEQAKLEGNDSSNPPFVPYTNLYKKFTNKKHNTINLTEKIPDNESNNNNNKTTLAVNSEVEYISEGKFGAGFLGKKFSGHYLGENSSIRGFFSTQNPDILNLMKTKRYVWKETRGVILEGKVCRPRGESGIKYLGDRNGIGFWETKISSADRFIGQSNKIGNETIVVFDTYVPGGLHFK